MAEDQRISSDFDRRLVDIQKVLHRIEDKMVPRPEFEMHREETNRRLKLLEDTKSHAHSTIYARIEAESSALNKKVELVRAENDRRELDAQKWARDVNVKVWITIGGAAFTLLASFVLTLTQR